MRNIDAQSQQQAARAQLKLSGYEGTGGFGYPPLTNIDGDYSVVGRFRLEAKPQLLDGETFPLPVGLRLLVRPGDLLLGPPGLRELGEAEPAPCYPGSQTETVSLALPAGWRTSRIPNDMTLDDDLLHYESRWAVTDRTVSVRRVLMSKASGPLCEGEDRRQASQALVKIRRDLDANVGLAR